MSKSVTLDGQIIHGLDRFGLWRINSMEGWDETPGEKTNSESRPFADGDYEAPVFYGPRLVTLNGRLSASNPGDAFTARERLTSLLRNPGRFQVDQFGLPRWANARRGRIKPGQIKGRHLPFQMELRFIDSYKYGESYAVPGNTADAASLYHRGTAPAWPVVTVSASSSSGYTLTLNGRQVVVTRAIASSAPHEIDFSTGILRVGGSVVRGGLSTANFSPINPGTAQNMFISTGTGSYGSVTVRYNDTFI